MSNIRQLIIQIFAAAFSSYAGSVVIAQPVLAGEAHGAASHPGNISAGNNLSVPTIPPLILLDPTEIRTNPTLARGCWVRLFPARDFKGTDDIAIAGPVELASLHTPAGVDWKQKAERLIVGPKAILTVYENQAFRDKAATFKPGTQVTALRKQLKFTQSIDSLKIGCEK